MPLVTVPCFMVKARATARAELNISDMCVYIVADTPMSKEANKEKKVKKVLV